MTDDQQLLDIADLVSNRVKTSVDFENGRVVRVEFYPAAITGEMLASITSISHPERLGEDEAVAALNTVTEHLLTLLAAWNLGAGGAPLAIDEPTLKRLGLMNQWSIFNGIMGAANAMGKSSAPTATITPSK